MIALLDILFQFAFFRVHEPKNSRLKRFSWVVSVVFAIIIFIMIMIKIYLGIL